MIWIAPTCHKSGLSVCYAIKLGQLLVNKFHATVTLWSKSGK